MKSTLFTVSCNDDDECHDDDNDAKSFDDNEATKLNIIRLFLHGDQPQTFGLICTKPDGSSQKPWIKMGILEFKTNGE